MDTPRFNDAVLNHILDTLTGRVGSILHEQQVNMQNVHLDFNQWADNMKVAQNELAMQLEQERTHAGRQERWADFVVQRAGWTSNQMADAMASFETAEQRLQDGITDAIAPVTPDHTCTNCYADQGPCTGSCAADVESEPTLIDPDSISCSDEEARTRHRQRAHRFA